MFHSHILSLSNMDAKARRPTAGVRAGPNGAPGTQIDPERIRAEYRDGVLALFIPRAEREKPRSIKIT
jgi:hypothetical protein